MSRRGRLPAGKIIGAAAICAAVFTLPAGVAGQARLARDYVAPDGRNMTQLIADHVLPDPSRTPGALNPKVTQATILSTICRPGWAATVRPPREYTDALKLKRTPPGHSASEYEFDHLYSIEDGGDPAKVKNLWMEVHDDLYGSRVKDRLETKVARMICTGEITLKQAQAAIGPNWLIGYQRYVGPLPTQKSEVPPHRSRSDASGDDADDRAPSSRLDRSSLASEPRTRARSGLRIRAERHSSYRVSREGRSHREWR